MAHHSRSERGRIGAFDRSHCAEVTVVRVHPEFLVAQNLPPGATKDHLWRRREVRSEPGKHVGD